VRAGFAYSSITPVRPIILLSLAGGLSSSAIPHPMNAVGIATAAYHPSRAASNAGPDADDPFCCARPPPTAAAVAADWPATAASSAPVAAVPMTPPMKAFARSFRAARFAALSAFVTSRRTGAAVDSRRASLLTPALTTDPARRIDLDEEASILQWCSFKGRDVRWECKSFKFSVLLLCLSFDCLCDLDLMVVRSPPFTPW